MQSVESKERNYLEMMLSDFSSLTSRSYFKEHPLDVIAAIPSAIKYIHSLDEGFSVEMENVSRVTKLSIEDTHLLVLKVILGYIINPSFGFCDMVFTSPAGTKINEDWLGDTIRNKTSLKEWVSYGDEDFLFEQVSMSIVRNSRK